MIFAGDCREFMRSLADNSVDAIVTDPPYHLKANKKDDPRRASPDGKQRGRGFMRMEWDGGDVAFRPETWVEALRVAKPGAHLLAFGGTRTFHRLMCAIEDGGWELRDTLQWIYSTGYPKSLNLCRCNPHVESDLQDAHGWHLCAACGEPYALGTALKPAWEPIVLARKPLSERNVRLNVARWGTGALNIEACRIANLDPNDPAPGRWPANVLHDGSGEVLACFPAAPGAKGDVDGDEPGACTRHVFDPSDAYRRSPSSRRRDGEASAAQRYAERGATNFALLPGDRRPGVASAARFFYCAKASREERNRGLHGFPERPLHWSSGEQSPGTFQRAGTRKRAENHHPCVKPVALMRWLCRLACPPGGVVADLFTGSGSTGCGAIAEGFQFIGSESETEYIPIAEARIAAVQPGLPMEAFL